MSFNLKLKIISILFALFILPQMAFGQKTGSFNASFQFNGETRTVSYYVPTDYNQANKYKLMVCLHGMGDNSTNFRNALITSLQWNTFMPNTIFACPDGGSDQSRDFYSPSGDERIIDSTIRYTQGLYNIDDKEIILEGFSLGGRSALRYGLDSCGKFKGLLLNTPAVQGIKDAKNTSKGSVVKFKYANASKIPIAITHGATDGFYTSVVDTTYMNLILNNCPVSLSRVAGMGHSIPGKSVIQKLYDFINQPKANQTDAEIVNVFNPERIYSKNYAPSFRFRNIGADTIQSISGTYSINSGAESNFNWDGSLAPFAHAEMALGEADCKELENTVTVHILKINGADVNQALAKKSDSATFMCITEGLSLPQEFKIESTEPNIDLWGIHPSGHYQSWALDNGVKYDGNCSLFMYNSILAFDNSGLSEDLLSPVFDLTTAADPSLSFELAFNYQKYTPPYFSVNTIFTDTLNILISTDGGKTFDLLYSKSGAELATADEPILNPLSLQACFFSPSSDEWRKEIVRLDEYANSKKAYLTFKYISGLGGSINIDRIKFSSNYDAEDVAENTDGGKISLSPNPASDLINIQIPAGASELKIFSIEGQLVSERKVSSAFDRLRLDVSGFAPGIYFVETSGAGLTSREKFVVTR